MSPGFDGGFSEAGVRYWNDDPGRGAEQVVYQWTHAGSGGERTIWVQAGSLPRATEQADALVARWNATPTGGARWSYKLVSVGGMPVREGSMK
jgi:hypothetical protein